MMCSEDDLGVLSEIYKVFRIFFRVTSAFWTVLKIWAAVVA